MSRRAAKRVAAGNVDSLTVSLNEQILADCHSLYVDTDDSLMAIGAELGLAIEPPRKKINIMLIGNHSAGKSSFVNWYIEETIQKTGVAIETQGFTLVTSGRKRETLTGNATMHLYPMLKELEENAKVMDYLNTEITTSKQKKFPLITFIDTPGLVDGEMQYPFDVDETIRWMGRKCDLIFVFFDPIGQALCKRTLNIVEDLNEVVGEKIRFYLSKADTAGLESDRQKVLMQIVQELCKRPGLNKAGFDMPTIYVPTLAEKPGRCVNQIEEVCKDVDKSIAHTLQSTLNTLETDCDMLIKKIDDSIEVDSANSASNIKARLSGILLGSFGLLLPLAFLSHFLLSLVSKKFLSAALGDDLTDSILSVLTPAREISAAIPADDKMYYIAGLVLTSVILLICAKLFFRTKPTLSRRTKKARLQKKRFIIDTIKPKKDKMYTSYLQQCMGTD